MLEKVLDWMSDNPGLTIVLGIMVIIVISILR